uniref:Uncharacterized protein n=1 Tax=Rhizophora mucronata TaxID=61149 RepID=A0A2P2NHY8_RHIMU
MTSPTGNNSCIHVFQTWSIQQPGYNLGLITSSSQLPKLISTKCIDIAVSRNAQCVPQASSNAVYLNAQ